MPAAALSIMAFPTDGFRMAACWSSLVVWLLVLPQLVFAGPANTTAVQDTDLPPTMQRYLMCLTLSIPMPHGSTSFPYGAYPLTPQVGLGDPNAWRAMHVEGRVLTANVSNYQALNVSQAVVLLSCDPSGSNETTTQTVLNAVMERKPTAIVLYSLGEDACVLEGTELSYNSLWTMASSMQANNAVKNAEATTNYTGTIEAASLSGDGNDNNQQQGNNNSNSAVAMSILYSITGLITLLFLIIIFTGAVRAHRNPERYGPRAAGLGRGRQSRAKGIARAVLETLPIVKFGDPKPTKPDPEIEIETVSAASRQDGTTEHEANAQKPKPSTEVTREVHVEAASESPETTEMTAVGAVAKPENDTTSAYVGCSICTEDFKVGEDVRVLPCDHNFHPACIDPWLVNVSGTCPLCRLDLRPSPSADETGARQEVANSQAQGEMGVTALTAAALSATTATATDTGDDTHVTNTRRHSRRMSRLLHPGRQNSEHVDPLTLVEARQSHLPSEGSEQEQRRMERILRVLRIRTRRQETTTQEQTQESAHRSTQEAGSNNGEQASHQ